MIENTRFLFQLLIKISSAYNHFTTCLPSTALSIQCFSISMMGKCNRQKTQADSLLTQNKIVHQDSKELHIERITVQ